MKAVAKGGKVGETTDESGRGRNGTKNTGGVEEVLGQITVEEQMVLA